MGFSQFRILLGVLVLNTTVIAAPIYNKISWMAGQDTGGGPSTINWDVMLMNTDGSSQQNLSLVGDPTNQFKDMDPFFSPQGDKILFTSQRTGDSFQRLYTMDPDGNNVTVLTPNTLTATRAKYSRDGTKVVFSRQGTGLAYFSVSTPSVITNIPNTTAVDDWPSFSPDGQWVTYQHNIGSGGTPQGKICRIKLDGSGLVELTDGTYGDEMPYYSPNGELLIFKRSTGTGDLNIDRMSSVDGSGVVNLTNNPTGTLADAPVYSWEGTYIAYQRSSTGMNGWEIYRMNSDTTNLVRLTNNTLVDWNPSFSPVPEPTSGLLIILGAGLFWRRNKKVRS